MKKIFALAFLFVFALGSVTQAASAMNSSEITELCGCDKCGKKDCDGSCDGKGDKKSCSKDKKKSCCKKGKKSCKKKEDEKSEESEETEETEEETQD